MIGERLAELRKDKCMTREYLAKLLGVSKHTVASYEQNKSTPNDDTKVKIAQIFNISLDYLLGATIIERPLNSSNRLDLPNDFPASGYQDLQKYAKLIYDNYRMSKQK